MKKIVFFLKFVPLSMLCIFLLACNNIETDSTAGRGGPVYSGSALTGGSTGGTIGGTLGGAYVGRFGGSNTSTP